jgi:mono/diheme cytochrome c family protein
MRRSITIVLIGVVALLLLGVTTLLGTLRGGFSALDEPSAIEAFMATTMRRYAVPADLKGAKNPLPLTPEILAEGRAHFADHCATCHGNDGKGKTAMGPNFYPKVPDMTLPATQSQSDGALFATIENGIRLTAMPAFGGGTAESAYGSWGLVHFIRHLPKITPEELTEMQKLNPKSPEEWELAKQEEAFLAGKGEAPPPASSHDAKPHRH